MNTHDDHPKAPGSSEGVGRRRFVRAVGVAVPVALTVSARSAMAATCNAVSAHASINMPVNSHNATTDRNLNSNAKDPLFLKEQNVGYFTSASANGVFSTVFGSGPSLTMREVLVQQAPSATFASYIAAAYVNYKKDGAVRLCYTLQNLQDMWDKGPSGTYQPVPGANWGTLDIINYLVDTWT